MAIYDYVYRHQKGGITLAFNYHKERQCLLNQPTLSSDMVLTCWYAISNAAVFNYHREVWASSQITAWYYKFGIVCMKQQGKIDTKSHSCWHTDNPIRHHIHQSSRFLPGANDDWWTYSCIFYGSNNEAGGYINLPVFQTLTYRRRLLVSAESFLFFTATSSRWPSTSSLSWSRWCCCRVLNLCLMLLMSRIDNVSH